MELVRPNVEVLEKSSQLTACASQWRLPSLTHADGMRRGCSLIYRWAESLGPSIGARTRTRAKAKVRPDLFVKQAGKKDNI